MKASKDFGDLVKLVRVLRRECPWDRKQTHHTIKDNLIEEAYEAVEAIDSGDFGEFKKELGDLLLHVLFHSRMAEETESFDIGEVIHALQEKLIRRHPHVFGDREVSGEQQVAENWEEIKKTEGKDSVLEGIPNRLPALIRAFRMQEKASNVGFDWSDWRLSWDKVEEEMEEFRQSLEGDATGSPSDEFGDLLFSLVNAGRLSGLNAEDCVRRTNRKFEQRFHYIEEQVKKQNRTLREVNLEEMDRLWEEAKKRPGTG